LLVPPEELEAMFARLKRAGYRTGDETDDEWIITDATGGRQVVVGRHGGAFYVRGSGPSPVHGSIAKIEATIKVRLGAARA
jgi:hypothetical protein